MSNERRWVRMSGPGELRGEGTWKLVHDSEIPLWEECKRTHYLPTAWEVLDHVDIFEKARPDVRPRFVVSKAMQGGEVIVDQKHKIAMSIPTPGDKKAQRWVVRQLQSMHKDAPS